MRSRITSKIITISLSAMLAFTMLPLNTFAAGETGISAGNKQAVQTGDSGMEGAEADTGMDGPAASDPEAKPDETESANQESRRSSGNSGSFAMSEKVDDVIVTVMAEEGVFPDDAVLSVKKLSGKEQKKVDAAVEAGIDEDKKVALSYSFDIKVLDAEGNELQPAEGQNVEVRFETVFASNPNLEAEIYHITNKDHNELEAEKIDAETDMKNETVSAVTDGFSSYTVCFTYDKVVFEFAPTSSNQGDFYLQEVLDVLQMNIRVKDVTEVRSSNPKYFEQYIDSVTGANLVKVKEFFGGTEKLLVTAGGVTYEIEVTCRQNGDVVEYIDENGDTKECHQYERLSRTRLQGGWYVIDQNMNFNDRIRILSGDVHLIICDGVKAELLQGISVPNGTSLSIYGQKDHSGELICQPKPQFKIDGETIEAQNAGIGGDGDSGEKKCGDITINGGMITAGGGMHHDAAIGGAEGQVNGRITVNGGNVYAKVQYGGKTGEGFTETVYAAAIGTGGGWFHSSSTTPGEITIKRGYVTAVAGGDAWGAAIGGGYHMRSPRITINGGVVKATGASGAGIGGGNKASGNDITINDGIVYSMSYGKGAGIGGGNSGNGGTVTINNGYVLALGGGLQESYLDKLDYYNIKKNLPNPGQDSYGPGEAGKYANIIADLIAPLFEKGQWGGAGIGGGDGAAGGTVIINGGIVTATAGMNSAQAIGHGDGGSGNARIDLYDTAQVTYGKLEGDAVKELGVEQHVTPDKRADRCRDNAYARIEPGLCTVTFDMQGHGEPVPSQTVRGMYTVTKPDDPEAEGYLFDGWYTEKECSNKYNFNLPVNAASMTLYARWIKTCGLKVTKKWPEGAGNPDSLKIEYALWMTRNRDSGYTSSDLELSGGSSWSGTIDITEESVLQIKEEPQDGYMNIGWVLSGRDANGDPVSIDLPSGEFRWATLDLHSKKDSGLSDGDYEKALAAVRNGSAELTLTNIKSKVFSVQKIWGNAADSIYRPVILKAVLQRKQSDGSWKTVETVGLNRNNGWKASFKAVDDLGADNEMNYRIRELDKDDNVVLDKEDTGSGGKDPVATLQTTIDKRTVDIDYTVTYGEMSDDGLVKITNNAGNVYSAELNWQNYSGEADTVVPDSVTVGLYYYTDDGGMSVIQTRELNASNDWKTDFAPVLEAGRKFVVREDSGNGHTVFNEGENIPAHYQGDKPNKAAFTVTENRNPVEYSYDVAYSAKAQTRLTTITNKRTGVSFKVRKDWEFSRGSLWNNRVDHVYAVLQHRETDGSGNVTWKTVGKKLRLLPKSWEDSFPAIQLSEEFKAEDYRIRELVKHFTDHGANRYITYFDTEPPAVDEDGQHYKIMPASDDEDNTSREMPVFKAEYKTDSNAYEKTAFAVTYDKDKDGTFIITNRQVGNLTVEKKWQDEDGNDLEKSIPESILAVLQHKSGGKWENVGEAVTLNGKNDWKDFFDTYIDENADMSAYRVRELGEDGSVIYDKNDQEYQDLSDEEKETSEANHVSYHVMDEDGGSHIEKYTVEYDKPEDRKTSGSSIHSCL